MTDKKVPSETPVASLAPSQPLSLDTLKVLGGLPGQQPPVKRVLTWERGDGESFTFDTYVRLQSYRVVQDLFEGDRKFSYPMIVSRMICDEKGKEVFTEDQAMDMHQDLVSLLVAEVAKVNDYGKKKQPAGKKLK